MEAKITFYNEELRKLDSQRVQAQFKSKRTLDNLKAIAEKYLSEISKESHSAFDLLRANLISFIGKIEEDLRCYYELFLMAYLN